MPDMSFQATLARLLRTGERSVGSPHAVLSQPGFSVYRNTVAKGLVDALVDNYPTIERLVGREWFRSCAAEFSRGHPPTVPMLALYGEGFADFLAQLPASVEFPYLPDVARLDRLWTEAHVARDAPTLSGVALAQYSPEVLFERRPLLHPATRLAWLKHSAVTVWQHHRAAADADPALEIEDTDEGALLTRPHGAVECIALEAPAYEFLSHIASGDTLGTAAATVLSEHPTADLAGALARLVAAGVFAGAETFSTGQSE